MKKGDKISWNTSQGATHGTLVEKHTEHFEFEGQKFNATKDDPYWVVQSDKTDAKAAHKESSLDAE